jgi:RNA polymerase sigma factor (sigma-70 family)
VPVYPEGGLASKQTRLRRPLLLDVVTQIDPERWGELYEEAFPDVYRALVATLLDREAARDALHDAFVIGLERPPEDINLKGWLFRVALRRARRGLRRIPRFFTPPRSGENLVQQALDRVEAGRLLLLLSERQRSIVVAHYYLGLTQVEIAASLGIARGTVGATIAKALARMRTGDLIA